MHANVVLTTALSISQHEQQWTEHEKQSCFVGGLCHNEANVLKSTSAMPPAEVGVSIWNYIRGIMAQGKHYQCSTQTVDRLRYKFRKVARSISHNMQLSDTSWFLHAADHTRSNAVRSSEVFAEIFVGVGK